MGDRGNVFYAPTGETTEWEDILVKKGILVPKTKVPDETEYEAEAAAAAADPRENATLDELDELEDDYDDDAELARIRERRIHEMMAQASRNKFGDVRCISKDEWTKEVTDGSSEQWVVAYLWDEALEECKVMDQVLRDVAKKHRDVKFVSIQAQACIENWPSRNCPTLFMYHKGTLQNQLLGIRKLHGLDMKVEGSTTCMVLCVVCAETMKSLSSTCRVVLFVCRLGGILGQGQCLSSGWLISISKSRILYDTSSKQTMEQMSFYHFCCLEHCHVRSFIVNESSSFAVLSGP